MLTQRLKGLQQLEEISMSKFDGEHPNSRNSDGDVEDIFSETASATDKCEKEHASGDMECELSQ
eukprot:12397845-Karenia_brevis.AAC.1